MKAFRHPLYPDCRIRGPHTRKNGRQQMELIYDNGKHSTVPYARFLMELSLNRRLIKSETVVHIDKNFRNTNINNLKIVKRGEKFIREKNLTHKYLKTILEYDRDSGDFIWIKPATIAVPINSKAGKVSIEGYISIQIDNKKYQAHRLAYFYIKGVWPKHIIHHVDRNKLNNSWKNLKHMTRTQHLKEHGLLT